MPFYRSPSQNQKEFIENVELNLDRHWKVSIFMINFLVNFNSELKSLYKNDNTSIRDQKLNF